MVVVVVDGLLLIMSVMFGCFDGFRLVVMLVVWKLCVVVMFMGLF